MFLYINYCKKHFFYPVICSVYWCLGLSDNHIFGKGSPFPYNLDCPQIIVKAEVDPNCWLFWPRHLYILSNLSLEEQPKKKKKLRVHASSLRRCSWHGPEIKCRSTESPPTTYWVREKKTKLGLIGIHGCPLSTSDVSIPSTDWCGQLSRANKTASSSESSLVCKPRCLVISTIFPKSVMSSHLQCK